MSTQKVNLTVTNYIDLLNDRPVRAMGHLISHEYIASHPSLGKAYVIIDLDTLVFTGGTYATRVTDDGADSIFVVSPIV